MTYLRTVLHAQRVFLTAPWSRDPMWAVAKALGHRELPAPTLERVSMDRVARSDAPIVLRELSATTGNVTVAELLTLARLVKDREPCRLFEIGTFDGRTTLNLALNAPDCATVVTLDLSPNATPVHALASGERAFVDKPESGARFRGTSVAPRITQVYGDSATFDFAPYAGAMDFVFVDGSHAYEYAKTDSLTALGLLRGGKGTIVWHDYDVWPGVSRALHELRERDHRFAALRWIEGTSLVVLDHT